MATEKVSIFLCFPLLMLLSRSIGYHFHLLLYSLFIYLAMRTKRNSRDLFGAAELFSGSQLPTYADVGKAWRQCRLDLESEKPGTKVLNRQVARKVRQGERKFVICQCAVTKKSNFLQ